MFTRKFYKKSDLNSDILAVLGGVGGFGLSYLNKYEKKHKLRNALIGATALPGAYLLAKRLKLGNEVGPFESPSARNVDLGLGLAATGTAGLLGMYGMGTHMIDVWRDKYGPAPEGVDEIAYYDFLEKQEEAKRLKDLEKSRAEGIKALLANKPDNVSPDAYKDFLNANYNA